MVSSLGVIDEGSSFVFGRYIWALLLALLFLQVQQFVSVRFSYNIKLT